MTMVSEKKLMFSLKWDTFEYKYYVFAVIIRSIVLQIQLVKAIGR